MSDIKIIESKEGEEEFFNCIYCYHYEGNKCTYKIKIRLPKSIDNIEEVKEILKNIKIKKKKVNTERDKVECSCYYYFC